MKAQANWGRVWEQIVDYVVPLLQLKPTEQAIYFFLLRQTRMKGERVATLSKRNIAEGTQRSVHGFPQHLMKVAQKGCMAVRARSSRGLTVEVFLPEEIVGWLNREGHRKVDLSRQTTWSGDTAKRMAIFRRDRRRCFYCRRRLRLSKMWLDHLEPRSSGGSARKENMVACCRACNMDKGASRASRYLVRLYRMKRLNPAQYKDRMKALRRLQLALAEAMEG